MPVHKSAALQQLAGLATGDFDVPPFVSFAVDEWHSDRARVLADVGRVLGAARLMVRSDRASEGDTEAGAWLSEGAIAGDDAPALAAAVERVIASYGAWRADDRVLLQCQVLGAEAAGVAASRALPDGAAYRAISLLPGDSNAGVTGACSHGWTVYEHACPELRLGPWIALRSALAEVLQRLRLKLRSEIEIEWLWAGGRLQLVQLRYLSLRPQVPDTRLRRLLRATQARLVRIAAAEPAAVHAWMPDWNPAELLGEHPRPLALSLFRTLIADRCWGEARARMGYARSVGPLLRVIAGRPYVRVAQSLASLLPASLPPDLRTQLVARQLGRLRAHPEWHDRVEFAVASSGLEFGDDWHARCGHLSPALVARWREAQLAMAGMLFSEQALMRDIERARFALHGQPDWPAHPAAWRAHLRWLRDTLVLPFAQSARRCFAYEALLRSAQRLGAIDGEALAGWRAAASPLMSEDAVAWSGALRPGTFEISSARLGEQPAVAGAASRAQPACMPPGTRRELDALCRQSGLALDAGALQRGFQLAHRARDLGKLAMSVHLSAGLEALARTGEALGLDRDALSWLVVADLDTAPAGWPARIARRRARHRDESALRMPALIDADTRLDAVVVPPGQPVYLGRGRVQARLRRVGLHTRAGEAIAGAVLLLERCEPGFDWLFNHAPAALVTAFGGPNAHVALRAHELGVPALLGVGPEALRRMAGADSLEIDFDAGWWRAQAAPARRQA